MPNVRQPQMRRSAPDMAETQDATARDDHNERRAPDEHRSPYGLPPEE
jgi:hypothetical protein